MRVRVSNELDVVLRRLRKALDAQRVYLSSYEKPCEPIAYETLRTFDDLFFRDLMEPKRKVRETDQHFRSLSTWGVNHALRRVVPRTLGHGPFRDFPSNEDYRARADDFIFNCGVLAVSERLEGWLAEGILTGELRPYPNNDRLTHVLVLRSAVSSYLDEEIGMAGLRWAGDDTREKNRSAELILEEQHRTLAPELERRVDLIDGWRVVYSSTQEIDDYFFRWAQLYLRRIFSQDMIGSDDLIGGRPFSRYLSVLSALSGRSQKHIAFGAILRARNESVHIRNLLTSYCPRKLFIESLAGFLDAERLEVEDILRSLILTADNLDAHTAGGETAWAPIVQASTDHLILPLYGIDINPFLFLLTDLRFRFESDWFRIANNRERRWVKELSDLFPQPRWKLQSRNVRIREGGKDLTDIDFTAYDTQTNEIAFFQLKWQHPVGMDNRGRRSAGKNLVQESNRWVETVLSWIQSYGTEQLMQRAGLKSLGSPNARLFVLGRYHVHFTGFEGRDERAVWSDWAHFRKACLEESNFSVAQLASRLSAEVEHSRSTKVGEAMMFPVGDIALVLNPISVPDVN